MTTKQDAGSKYKSANICYEIGTKPIFCVIFEIPNLCVYVETINLGRWPNRENFLYQTVNNPFHNNYDNTICQWIKILKGTKIVRVQLQKLMQNENIKSWQDLADTWKVSVDAAKEIAKVSSDDLYNEIYHKDLKSRPKLQFSINNIPELI